jgi:hypothetical protein
LHRRYSNEDLLLPLLDAAVGKLPELSPKAVVELVRVPAVVPALLPCPAGVALPPSTP